MPVTSVRSFALDPRYPRLDPHLAPSPSHALKYREALWMRLDNARHRPSRLQVF
jgi:hypothetical protein